MAENSARIAAKGRGDRKPNEVIASGPGRGKMTSEETTKPNAQDSASAKPVDVTPNLRGGPIPAPPRDETSEAKKEGLGGTLDDVKDGAAAVGRLAGEATNLFGKGKDKG